MTSPSNRTTPPPIGNGPTMHGDNPNGNAPMANTEIHATNGVAPRAKSPHTPNKQDAPKPSQRTPKNQVPKPEQNSTPFSRGTSMQSQGMRTGVRDVIKEFYAEDLKDSIIITVQEMLLCLMSRVVRKEDEKEAEDPGKMKEIYTEVAGAIQEACNEALQANAKGKSAESGEKTTKTEGPPSSHQKLSLDPELFGNTIAQIQAYCEASSETGRYLPLARIVNTIFKMLYDSGDGTPKIPHLRAALGGEERVVMLVNDPTRMFATHHSHEYLMEDTERSPDLLLTAIKAVKKIISGQPTSEDIWDVHVFAQRLDEDKSPDEFNRVRWPEALCAADLKKRSKNIPYTPPTAWSTDLTTVPANIIPGSRHPDPSLSKHSQPAISPTVPSDSATASDSRPQPNEKAASRSSLKRRAEEVKGAEAKRPKNAAYQIPGPSRSQTGITGPEQIAIYTGERLSAAINISHCLNFLVKDDVMYIYFFDRAGTIRTNGFNIIQNFPFLVMFFAILQRFDKVDWGYHPNFASAGDSSGEGDSNTKGDSAEEDDLDEKGNWPAFTVTLNDPDGKPINFTFDCPPSTTLHLQGRGSMVQEVKSDAMNPFEDTRSLSEEEMVIKVSRADCERIIEVDHLKKAYRLAETHGDIKGVNRPLPANAIRGHVPVLIACGIWEEPFTATFQRYGIKRPLTRRVVAMVFPRMHRITELGGSDFAGALLDCFTCHYALWDGGLHHRDISNGNLMFSKFMDITVGVLNDFDLAIWENQERKFARERTGTWRFMATSLQDKPEGELSHVYAFDAESFMWYLIWTTEQFVEGGKEQQLDKEGNVKPSKFDNWDSLSGNTSPANKLTYMFVAKLSTTKWHSYSKSVSQAMRDHFRLLLPKYEEDGPPPQHEPVFLHCYNGMAESDTVYNDWFNPRKEVKGKDLAMEKLQQRSLVDNKLWNILTRATYGIQTGPYAPSSSASPA